MVITKTAEELNPLPAHMSRHTSKIFDESVAKRFINRCIQRGITVTGTQHVPSGPNQGSFHIFSGKQVCVLQYDQDVVTMSIGWVQQR